MGRTLNANFSPDLASVVSLSHLSSPSYDSQDTMWSSPFDTKEDLI